MTFQTRFGVVGPAIQLSKRKGKVPNEIFVESKFSDHGNDSSAE